LRIPVNQDTPWDLTIPGLFYERVKDDFSQREQRLVHEAELTREPQGLQHQIRTTERILLFAPDRKMLIQLGPRLLVINALKPYPGWEGFKPRIRKAWEALQQVVEVRGLERIGLRYINQIELPTQEANLEEYFEFYPFVGKRLPQRMVSFISGAEFPYAEDRDRCRVQLITPAAAKESKIAILDIDYFLARPRAIEMSEVLDWIEEAHSRVEEIFEGCITDKLRGIFEEVK
jgi:uncharacterized protein (TIGR04255 family)